MNNKATFMVKPIQLNYIKYLYVVDYSKHIKLFFIYTYYQDVHLNNILFQP
jgi:hypothetical protein